MEVGNFRIERRLGSGGMGTVYLGRHAVIGSLLAIKVLHPHLASERAHVERFLNEARAVNLIRHDNIVAVFDIGLMPPEQHYLVMEYLEGATLDALGGGPLPAAEALPILLQICDALEAAHSAGVVHRDLKPENVFLVRRGGSDRVVKVVDFGLARLSGAADGDTGLGRVLGTPAFMAPEQWDGPAVDGRVDLYALGVLAYRLLTGRLPFEDRTVVELFRAHLQRAPTPPRQLNPAIPERLEAVLLTALEKSPADRFQSAAEMRAELAASLQPDAPRPPRRGTASGRPQRHRVAVSWLGRERRGLEACELSRGGMFICADGELPAPFTPAHVRLAHSGGELVFDAEVVRHVGPEQARAWGLQPGFAVQLHAPAPGLADALDRLARGLPVQDEPRPPAQGDDPEAEGLLRELEARADATAYGLLDASPDAEISDLRHRARALAAQIHAALKRMSPGQRGRADALLERLHAAATLLGTAEWRADYDAPLGNYHGVARCLASGLCVERLAALRAAFAAKNPDRIEIAAAWLQRGKEHASARRNLEALAAWEHALTLDPLSLELHQRYWALKRASLNRARIRG